MFITATMMMRSVREVREMEGERENAALGGQVEASFGGCVHWIVGRCSTCTKFGF